ncbi:type VI secretion protein IcmF/TssM N-terminal domain-containing protein [Desulfosarcina cetonica]|uniref:type VI secretion protein IcmF/TssM N-terminal domain-containing protein n=1 Tax=Desulfosarcina cetonica TaxID=90730 RepID=UPI0006D0C875|nr:type VI secretion protein IcmF/TssM N-terminal domain-containing protein [Desulfosarcina cetonica]
MKSLIIKILKIFLLLLLIALVLLLIFGLVLWIGWPLWVGGFFVLGLIGVLLGIVFVRKLLARRNEQNFVQQIIAQDESRIQSLSANEQTRSRELQERWKTSIEALRKSHLKKFGNPLYVLPWYMMIGESGSGKTTAIKGADLSSPFAEVNRTSGISGTRNCDWWFFEQAIVLDTAGRYAVPVDQERDSDEWQQFLSLLVKFRKREPLNGLVVTVPADQLMENNRTKLEGDAKSIRQRINELMRVLGAKFPVYVMVTKCDLIQGSVKFCDRLDAATLQQAMGRLNHPVVADNLAFGEQTMESMAERLKELRLLILNQASVQGGGGDPSLLMFPEEFQKLEPGLSAFMRGAFQENPYQETPTLRGLYFSSGRQEGTPYSHFLSAMGLIGAQDVLPGTNRGLFLHDFFSRILPADRGLFAPTQRTLEWSRLTKSLGLTAWVAVVIAMCGLLSFSFVNNLKALRDISNQFAQPPVFQGELTTDVLTLDRFRQAVNRIEKKNTNWWIPRLGLPESSRVEASLKQHYCNIFKTDFLKPFDQRMAARITAFSAETPADVLGQHAMHLVRRINLLRASMDGDGLDTLRKLPPIPYTSPLVGAPTLDDISAKLSELYRYYLAWQRPESVLNDELKDQQARLKHILTLNGVNLNWVAAWVNVSGEVPGVHMSDYWRGLVNDDDGAFVAPAFTNKGKTAIDTYLGEMEKALSEPLSIGSQKQAFMQWYPQAKINAGASLSKIPSRSPAAEVARKVAASRSSAAAGKWPLPRPLRYPGHRAGGRQIRRQPAGLGRAGLAAQAGAVAGRH